MYVKRVNFVIYLALAIVLGFAASFLFGQQSVQSGLVSGDISKANLYNKLKADPEMTVIEEKLKNDEALLQSTKLSLSLLQERVQLLDDLTARTVEACSDIPGFAEVLKSMESLQAKTYNTNQAIVLANEGIDKLADGKSAPEYETASNNTFIGFYRIENQLAVGKDFVSTAKAYLDGKEGEKAEQIASLAGDWVRYCMQDAVLNNSADNVAYWNNTVSESIQNGDALGLVSEGCNNLKAVASEPMTVDVDAYSTELFDNAPFSLFYQKMQIAAFRRTDVTDQADFMHFQEDLGMALRNTADGSSNPFTEMDSESFEQLASRMDLSQGVIFHAIQTATCMDMESFSVLNSRATENTNLYEAR